MPDLSFGPRGWTPDRIGDLQGKTFVITGATAGTGYEATKMLLTQGARVIMLNRNPEKSAATIETLKAEVGAEAQVESIQMDLSSLSSVRQAAAAVLVQAPQIDALICNAAIAQVATRELTADGFESQFGVNHLGHFLLVGLLFECIKASSGRVVVVGSNAYRMGGKRIRFEDINWAGKYSAWNAYAQSKLAQMMFGFELERRVRAANSGVQVHVCHPGAAQTDLIKGKASPVVKFIWGLLSPLAQTAAKGARPEVMCATETGLAGQTLYGPTKRGEMLGPVGVCKLEDFALDEQAATQLWDLSVEMTGFDWTGR